jgi:hypothetical protein
LYYSYGGVKIDKNQTVNLILKNIIGNYEINLEVKTDTPKNYYLDTRPQGINLFFSAVQIKKNYDSYHLFPVYVYPDLLLNLFPNLKKECKENHVLILGSVKV